VIVCGNCNSNDIIIHPFFQKQKSQMSSATYPTAEATNTTQMTSPTYKSTRGVESNVFFRDVVLKGLAVDGERR
jgi:hypothetical protein